MDGITAISQRVSEIRALLGMSTISRPQPTETSDGAGFGQVFDAVMARGDASASVRTADGVPVDLARYGNGRIPASALKTVNGTAHRLWAPAAGSLEQLVEAAGTDGVTIGITDSYRSYESQVDVAARKGLYSQGGLAATPGTSPHGWGVAVDLRLDARAQAWMRVNAGSYGFVEDTPREPWHWVFKG